MDDKSRKYLKNLPEITQIFKDINDKFNDIAPLMEVKEYHTPLTNVFLDIIKFQYKQIKLLTGEEIGD